MSTVTDVKPIPFLKLVWAFSLPKCEGSGNNGKFAKATRFSAEKGEKTLAMREAAVLDPRDAFQPKAMPAKNFGIAVVAHVVTNPNEKVIQTEEVWLYDDGKGGLAKTGKPFTNDWSAKQAIKHMQKRDQNGEPGGIRMFIRNGKKHAREAKGMFV